MIRLKRWFSVLFCAIFLFCLQSSPLIIAADGSVKLYVSPNGSDKGDGTIQKPFRTMERAKAEVRKYNSNMTDDIYVYFLDGVYHDSNVQFSAEDSGTNGFQVVYTAYEGATPIFDGGEQAGNWTLFQDGIYKTQLAEVEDMREFYVDGVRMPRAATKPIQGFGFDSDNSHIKVLSEDLPETITNPQNVQTKNNYNWRIYYLPVEKIDKIGDYAQIVFQKPYITTYMYDFNFEVKFDGWLCLENALEFLDEEGEWFFDKTTKILYYKPVAGQDINTISAFAPKTEKFFSVKGTDVTKPVENLKFENLTFRYSGWTDPNEKGFCSVQATSRVGENGAYSSMMHGCVSVDYAKNITFDRNVFEHTAANAITMLEGIDTIQVTGNIFSDIGGGAVSVGTTEHGKKDIPEIPVNVKINNNIMRDIGMEYWGAPAVTFLYTKDSEICHNDIDGAAYSGVSIGWGWSKDTLNQKNNLVGYNKIFNYNRKVIDGAAIYSLSRNDGSGYVGNYVGGTNAPFNTGALYHDEQSEGFDDYHNVVESERESYLFYNLNNVDKLKIHDCYVNTANIVNYRSEGKDIQIYNIHVVRGEWPQEAKEIISNAGLQAEFQDVEKKMAGIKLLPREPKPIVRSSGTGFVETKQFEPQSISINKAVHDAPFAEEGGSVVMDAIDYTEYKGFEACSYTWQEALANSGWMGEYSAKSALFLGGSYLDREEKDFSQKPTLGYDIAFQTPGKYIVSVRGRADAQEETLKVYFDGQHIGNLKFGKTYAYTNTNGNRQLTIDVLSAGTHKLTVEAIAGGGIYLDRLWLAQSSGAPQNGSIETGPMSNKRKGDFTYLDIPEKLTEETRPAMPKPRENIALGKTSVSSADYNEMLIAKNANDGVLTSDWVAPYNASTYWWMVDLGQPYNVSDIEVGFRLTADDANNRKNFVVEGSNDPEFKTCEVLAVHDVTPTPHAEIWSAPLNPLEKYRYIRLRKTAQEHFALGEVRIYADSFSEVKMKSITGDANKTQIENVTDGNISTIWSAGLKESYSFQAEFSKPAKIVRVDITFRNDLDLPLSRCNFEVWLSDDKDFKTYDIVGQCGNVPVSFQGTWSKSVKTNKSYQYIRFVKNGDFVSIGEIKAYEMKEN